jgi:hypothetical protein
VPAADLHLAPRDEEINNPRAGKPHFLLLGAGASYEALPNGDRNGLNLPLLRDRRKRGPAGPEGTICELCPASPMVRVLRLSAIHYRLATYGQPNPDSTAAPAVSVRSGMTTSLILSRRAPAGAEAAVHCLNGLWK